MMINIFVYVLRMKLTIIILFAEWQGKIIVPVVAQQKISCLHLKEYNVFQFIMNHPNVLISWILKL